MSTLYTINVTNNSLYSQTFYFFQKPAVYLGGAQVYSNAIYNQTLLPYASSGSVLTFQLLQQYYAGVQTQINSPVVGQASGYTTSSQPIDLTTSSSTNNSTNMIVTPSLGLTPPAYTAGVQQGAYRIVIPTFNPSTNNYNAGLAVKNLSTGAVILSNFVTAQPNQNLDCQPVVLFYVQTGSYQAGDVINFTSSSIGSALCDTTSGVTTFNVTYNKDGTWSVNNVSQAGLSQLLSAAHFVSAATLSASALSAPALSAPAQIAATAPAPNVDIRNEAGTAVISTGYAANLNPPFQVLNLSNPGAIVVHGEYQVGPTGGPFVGRMCTAILGNSATFA